MSQQRKQHRTPSTRSRAPMRTDAAPSTRDEEENIATAVAVNEFEDIKATEARKADKAAKAKKAARKQELVAAGQDPDHDLGPRADNTFSARTVESRPAATKKKSLMQRDSKVPAPPPASTSYQRHKSRDVSAHDHRDHHDYHRRESRELWNHDHHDHNRRESRDLSDRIRKTSLC
ncbi:hypothetical protein K438DRAFT_1782614 [Mycena galopus ATCC 62051]|nr:hypothetical protein K438DRAFT_1782614 [Mycena galopus ATCC 62051]